MIQANELRVGNLTMQGVVSEINMGYFRVLNENKESLKSTWFEIEPIPLTEEWLVKFGFEINRVTKENNNIWRKVWDEGHFELEEIISFFFGQPIHETQLQYVHQLQNLYFALTGEELTIKN